MWYNAVFIINVHLWKYDAWVHYLSLNNHQVYYYIQSNFYTFKLSFQETCYKYNRTNSK